MSEFKRYTSVNVYNAAVERLDYIFKTFDEICLSFSGGKDSTVLFHLSVETAKKHNKKFNVLFIDWEIQLSHTINFTEKMIKEYEPYIKKLYWVTVPLRTTNTTSMTNPEWTCWEEDVKWVREKPIFSSNKEVFPFWFNGITYEEFMPMFGNWLSNGKPMAQLIGIRTDESINRFRAISDGQKFDNKSFCNTNDNKMVKCYPIYDWKVQDIWRYLGKEKKSYNKLYDLMIQGGIPLSGCRICEPYGPEASRGLWLYHTIEPVLWSKMMDRVVGTNSWSNTIKREKFNYGDPPKGSTWKQQVIRLLDSLPDKVSNHYKTKISVADEFLKKNDKKIEDQLDDDLGSKDVTTWRRIYKMISKGDYWCKMLSFAPTNLSNYESYLNSKQKLIKNVFD